jgi:hypothetical protein
MCNLYSITTNQAAIIALFRVMNRYVGNLPPMPGVFPDYPAPVVRNFVRPYIRLRGGVCRNRACSRSSHMSTEVSGSKPCRIRPEPTDLLF